MKKLVAVLLENNTCSSLLVCKNVDEREYQKLLNETLKHKEQELKEKEELNNRVSKLEQKIDTLEHEIKVLKGEE